MAASVWSAMGRGTLLGVSTSIRMRAIVEPSIMIPRSRKVVTTRQGLLVYYRLKSLGLAVESLDDAFVMDLDRTVRIMVIGSETSAGQQCTQNQAGETFQLSVMCICLMASTVNRFRDIRSDAVAEPQLVRIGVKARSVQ